MCRAYRLKEAQRSRASAKFEWIAGQHTGVPAASLVPRTRTAVPMLFPSGSETTLGAPLDEGNAQVTRVRRQGLEPRTRGLRDRPEGFR